MSIPDPIRLVEGLSRPAIYFILIALCVGVGFLVTSAGKGGGMRRLQRQADSASAAVEVASWGESGRVRAAFNLGLDALFIVLYVVTLALGCRMAADGFATSGRGALANLSILFAWVAVAAGVFDVIENIGLLRMIEGRAAAAWGFTVLCAKIKWVLVISTSLYVALTIVLLRGKFFA